MTTVTLAEVKPLAESATWKSGPFRAALRRNDDGLQPGWSSHERREERLAETWRLTLLWGNAGSAKIQQFSGSFHSTGACSSTVRAAHS